MDRDPIDIRRRNLPHWTRADGVYFVTFRLRDGEFTPAERDVVFAQVRSGDRAFYVLYAAVVMPDHVHLIVEPNAGVNLSRVTKGIKGVSARLVNEVRGVRGSLWQDESFDRLLRGPYEFDEKWNYILDNPASRGLVERGEDYAWLFLRE